MRDIRLEQGAFPVSTGYQPSRSLSGPAEWAPQDPPSIEEGGGDIEAPHAGEGGFLPPTGGSLPPSPQGMPEMDVAILSPFPLARFMGHEVVLSRDEVSELRRLLARAVARQLNDERNRILSAGEVEMDPSETGPVEGEPQAAPGVGELQ